MKKITKFLLHCMFCQQKKVLKVQKQKKSLICVELRADKSIKEALCINDLTVNKTCPS